MVTVVKTPQGHKIIDQAIAATIIDSSGDALITFPYHALNTGSFVYITSDIDEYNGFWYVTVIDYQTFKISEYQGGAFAEFYQEIDIDYYQTQSHDWSAIFLPIVYKITNDRWPVNSVDTLRTISSATDDNGFTNLNLSGVLKSSFNALEFVEIVGAGDEDLNGVWQIVEVISTSDITINLPYAVGNSFVGATIQYYYNNYQVKIKVFSGLSGFHLWAAKKPYEEMAELSLTPDDNNEVMFSVSDYIKSKVAIKNNLTLFSLPLNLDAFTGFYISTAESFDDSDNYTLTTNESAFTDDDFEGYAIAGKLPFKNLYSGDYADYVYTSGSPAQWLTTLSRLLGVEDLYFDISFIKNLEGDFFVRINKYVSDYLTSTEDVQYSDQGIGVYRVPFTLNALYDSFCVQVFKAATTGFVPAVMDPLDTWTNVDTGGPAWILEGATPVIDTNLLGLNVTSDNWHTDYAFEAGRQYSFGYSFLTLGNFYHIDIVDASNNVLTNLIVFGDVAPKTGVYTFIAPTGAAGINIWFFQGASCGSPSGACKVYILSFTNETPSGDTSDAFAITEEICIDIIELCDAESGIGFEDRRLLEDGGFRLLE